MKELNKWTLASLRAKAEQIDDIHLNPKSVVYKSLITYIEECDGEQLKTLSGAGIKWFSRMADNRLRGKPLTI